MIEIFTSRPKTITVPTALFGAPLPLKSRRNVRRNSKCPCGSGKKFKACCANKRPPKAIDLTVPVGG